MRSSAHFWSVFSANRSVLEARLSTSQGTLAGWELHAAAPELVEALFRFDPGLTLEAGRFDGLYSLVVGAGGIAEDVPSARELALGAPMAPGWLVRALRPRRDPGATVREGATVLQPEALRFAYRLANDRMVALILGEPGVVAQDPNAHYLARRIVLDLLGEEDFADWIEDVRFVGYEDWLAASPGGRCWPLREMAARFDAIFHPPARATQRPVAALAKVA